MGANSITRLTDYIKKRAALAEEYARGLQKLHRQFSPALPYEIGLDELLKCSDRIVGSHLQLAEQVQESLLDGLKVTSREHERLRREILADIRNYRSVWKKTLAAFDKMRKNKDATVRAVEEARLAFERANADKNVTKAYVERLREEYAAKARKTLVCKEEYIQAAQIIKAQQQKLYKEDLPEAFNKLQRTEEFRLQRLKSHLNELGVLVYGAAKEEATCLQSILSRWDKFSPVQMIQNFIENVRSDVPFEYPEEILTDACTTTECLGLTTSRNDSKSNLGSAAELPKLSRSASLLLLSNDSDGIRKRLAELEKEIPAAERHHEGIKSLHRLYSLQPELADEPTCAETERQLTEVVAKLSSLQLERDQLQKKLDGSSPVTISTGSTTPSVLWKDEPSVKSPYLTNINTNIINSAGLTKPILKARVLFDFDAAEGGNHELPVKSGDELVILHKDGDWWQAKLKDGRIGYVPSNYLEECQE